MTLDSAIRGVRQQALEERFLFLLLLLRQPRARLIYVTSQAIHPDVVDYYLDLLPGVFAGHARKRLFLVSPLDGSLAAADAEAARAAAADRAHPLADSRSRPRAPRAVQHDGAGARARASALGIPMYGADPQSLPSRHARAARERSSPRKACRIRSASRTSRHSTRSGRRRSSTMRRRKPSISRVVAKLNEGVSGAGNANVDLVRPSEPGDPAEHAAVLDRVAAMKFESPRDDARALHREARRARRHRRGADQRPRLPQPERAAARDAARRGRSALDARPDARRTERPGLPGMPVPGESRLRRADHARGAEGRPPTEEGRRARPLRARLRRGAERPATSGRSTRSRSTCGRAARRIRS